MRIWPADPDGGYVAQCVELPGCISEGDTEAEALANITNAIEEMLASVMRDMLGSGPVLEPDEGELRSVKIAVCA